MALSVDELQRSLREQGWAFQVGVRRDGQLMLESDAVFPDGDSYSIYLFEIPGGVRLSDQGDTIMRISFEQDIDAFVDGERDAIDGILADEGMKRDGWVFYLDAAVEGLGEGGARIVRGIGRVWGLADGKEVRL